MSNPDLSRPTDAELAILRALWRRGPSTAFALIAVLALSLGVGAVGLKPGLVGVAQGHAEISLEGEWIGGWQDKGAWVFAKTQFKTEQGTLKATFDLLQALEEPKSFTVGKVSLTGAAFRLEATKDAVILVLEGRLDGVTIKGEWRRADARGAFTLLRVARVEPKLFDQYVGSYQLGPDNFISIGRQTRTGQNPRLCYVERKSGRRGNLTPLSDMTFIGGPALVYESEWDKDVPAKESAAIIDRALQKAGNKDYTIEIFPNSQHGQWAMATEHPFNPLSHRVHYDLLFDWLLRHVKASRR